VENLPKMDKSINFHWCTAISDVLWPIGLHFFCKDNTNCIWFFAFHIVWKVVKFPALIERPKAKSVSALRGFAPMTPWPGILPLDSAGGSAPRLPLWGLTVVFGGFQLSGAGTVCHGTCADSGMLNYRNWIKNKEFAWLIITALNAA